MSARIACATSSTQVMCVCWTTSRPPPDDDDAHLLRPHRYTLFYPTSASVSSTPLPPTPFSISEGTPLTSRKHMSVVSTLALVPDMGSHIVVHYVGTRTTSVPYTFPAEGAHSRSVYLEFYPVRLPIYPFCNGELFSR